MALNAKTRERVYERDQGKCWHCGTDQNLSIQHRANRGMGGSKSRDNAANLILLCWYVNFEMEASDKKARIARVAGWKLSQYDDPTVVPVWHHPSQQWLLLDDAWNARVNA